jgi:hypothetical protein
MAVLEPGSLPSYGADPFRPATWDADMLQGCHCDGYPEWNSTGLSERGGRDRGAWGGVDCVTLAFKGLRTAPINFDAAPWEVAGALQALASVGGVRVSAGDGSAGVCGGGGGALPSNTFPVTFTTLLGAQPRLVVEGGALVGPGGGVSLSVDRVAAGRGLLLQCSGHGICDAGTGLCNCLPGYASSNGAGGPGGRGDCGVAKGTGGQ